MASFRNECFSCDEGGCPEHECPKAKRDCGHHCNCSWIHDGCCWCGAKFGAETETKAVGGEKVT